MPLEMIVGEYLHKTPTKYLIQATAEDLKREAGCLGDLTDIPIEILQHATTHTLCDPPQSYIP